MTTVVNQQRLNLFLTKANMSQFNDNLQSKWRLNYVKVSPMTIGDIHSLCSKINKNSLINDNKLAPLNPVWRKGQYKLFTWFVALYCFTQLKKIQQLTKEDFQEFAAVFLQHPQERIKYQLYCLIPFKAISRKKWTEGETLLLNRLILEQGTRVEKIQWKVISYQLYEHSSGEYIRTFKECRQRWMNHCNPELNKQQWTKEEDYALFQEVLLNGKQWSRIAKEFKTQRTEHMIKNRYHALVQKQKNNNSELSLSQLELLIFRELKKNQMQDIILNETSPINKSLHIDDFFQAHQVSLNIGNDLNFSEKMMNRDLQPHTADNSEEKQVGYSQQFDHIKESPRFFKYENHFEEEKFKFNQVEELRLLRNQLLDKLGFSCGDILTPFNHQESKEAIFSQKDSY